MKVSPVSPGTGSAGTQNAESGQKAVEPIRSAPVSDRLEMSEAASQVEVQFSTDRATRQMVVRVVDASTNELIREIPPEKVRRMAESLMEFAGRLVDIRG